MSIFNQGSLAFRCDDKRCAKLLGAHYFYFIQKLPPEGKVCVVVRNPYELSVDLKGPDRKYGIIVKRVVDLLLDGVLYQAIPCEILERAQKNN